MNVQRTFLLKSLARLALAARIAAGGRMEAVYIFGKDTRRGGLAHTPWPAEKIGVRYLPRLYCVTQGGDQRLLTHYGVKGGRAVL